MNKIVIDCPFCATKLRLPDSKNTSSVTCPKCKKSFLFKSDIGIHFDGQTDKSSEGSQSAAMKDFRLGDQPSLLFLFKLLIVLAICGAIIGAIGGFAIGIADPDYLEGHLEMYSPFTAAMLGAYKVGGAGLFCGCLLAVIVSLKYKN